MNSVNPTPNPIVQPFATSLTHLDLDLSRDDRPALVSSVLQACLRDLNGEPLNWQRVHGTDIARRLQWLLRLSRVSGVSSIDIQTACPACDVEIGLSLDLNSFEQADASDGDTPVEIECEPEVGVCLRLRLPTGVDQTRWAAEPTPDFARLATDLVLSVDLGEDMEPQSMPDEKNSMRPEWLPGIEAALEAADPLTALQIRTACPDCGHAFELPVDLEQLLLQRLMAEQTRVLRDIHRLASTYHWSEREILALSPKRRAFYLQCVGSGGDR
jgi:hypothetical protein